MKLRIMGPPDIVELWAARLAEIGIGGRTYPSRYGDSQLRWYGEVDDRVAESLARRVVQVSDTGGIESDGGSLATRRANPTPGGGRRRRLPGKG